ncbi:speckle-type POZ protein [Folsomia candida]|uniref:speckle-type POZ protein n=1 Tax=Folsomia candida TaxID=158441 RepID=UPI000B8FF875|nr:speckle-type POZ protein [Folsomia candida]
MQPSQQPSSHLDVARCNSRNEGLEERMAGDEISILDVVTRPATPSGTATSSLMDNLKPKKETVMSHKTKVTQLKPLGRIMYEWEWDITKFDKAFPLMRNAANFGKTKTLMSEKLIAGKEIGRKSEWNFVLSETNGSLSWHILLSKIIKKGMQNLHTAFSVKIVDKNGMQLLQDNRRFCDFGEHFRFGWNDFIDLENLYAQRGSFLVDNTLRIRVLFEMYADATQRDLESVKQDKDDFAKIVTHDLNRLRTATGTADVHLECEGKVFPVHKLILSARSEVFAKMFEATFPSPSSSRTKRSATAGGDNPPEYEQMVATVAIPDVEAKILEILLEYVYSGNVKPLNNPELLTGVIRAADKYELADLKSYCFNALMNFLNEDNIGQLAVLAHRHQADKNVRMNINGYSLRRLAELMKKKSFRDALKMEPDAFFPDDECM